MAATQWLMAVGLEGRPGGLTMIRFLYFAGFAYIALCGAIVAREVTQRAVRTADFTRPTEVTPPPRGPMPFSRGEQWFAAMKPYCNAVELDVRTRSTPYPKTADGAGYGAACFGLAGKTERARAIIEALPAHERARAASVLFNVAHPVADAGDDRASGPMMELVLDYWPNNYMALYHAGMSEFSLGQTALAQQRLRAFLTMYNADDGFTSAAKGALAHMEKRSGLRRLRPRTSVERERPAHP